MVLLVVLAPPALAATITDTYGNVAYDNGTMSWADLPSGIPYKTNNVYDEGSLKPLFSLVHGFINTIQPNAFPFCRYSLSLSKVIKLCFLTNNSSINIIYSLYTFYISCFEISIIFVIKKGHKTLRKCFPFLPISENLNALCT